MKKIFLLLISLLIFSSSSFVQAQPAKGLPSLFESQPYTQSETLGKISSNGKSLKEARESLQHEAQKVSADAVFEVVCQSQGVYRNGLTWEKRQASCDGTAVRWKNGKPASSPSSTPQ